MEIERIILPLRRWWILILAATVIAAVSSFVATLQQKPIYQARTTLMIGQTISDPNPTNTEFTLNQQLAENYANIANREPVKNATLQALGLQRLPQYFAQSVPQSQFIEIVVNDTIPQRAQVVANELAKQLTLMAPTSGDQDRQEFVSNQLDQLEVQIEETQQDIEKLQNDLGNLVSASQIQDTQSQLFALQTKLTSLQNIYTNLLSTTSAGALNTLTVIEPAAVPSRPIGPNKVLTILLAAAVGFVLSSGAAYLLDYLDNSVKTPEEIERRIKAPIIGYIPEVEENSENVLFVAEHPRHPVVDAYRSLRTNLEFTSIDKPVRTIFVASGDAGDGKSFIAANLAVSLSQAGKEVIVLDADMRRSNLHNFFKLSNDYGLSEIFRGQLSIEEALKEWKGGGSVRVITGGSPPPNPAELLGSEKMGAILSNLRTQADVVIIDGPPFLVPDAIVLASKVDGVLLVVRPGNTQKPQLDFVIEQLNLAGTKLLGVALNRIPMKRFGHIPGYHGLPYYYKSNNYYRDDEQFASDGHSEESTSFLKRIRNLNPKS
jgi:capsular exopolysaccharide synthesis family protein